jgi:transposase
MRAAPISPELGSFCQSPLLYYIVKLIMGDHAAGINIVNRTLTPRQRSTFTLLKPGQLADVRGRRWARQVDDRRAISGIIHMLRSGARWRDCPPEYGPYTTIYDRFNRWSREAIWLAMFKALTGSTRVIVHSINRQLARQGAPLGRWQKRGPSKKAYDARAADARQRSTPSPPPPAGPGFCWSRRATSMTS